MALQNFVSKSLPAISALWLNQVDKLVQLVFQATDAGVVNAAVVTLNGGFTTFTRLVGSTVSFTAITPNTGPATLNVNGTGVAAITNQLGQALTGGELSIPATVVWNGVSWQIVQGLSPGLARTLTETANAIIPTNYLYEPGDIRRQGAIGDGAMNSTLAIIRAINALSPGSCLRFQPNGLYMVDSTQASGLFFNGKANFRVEGNNATIKVLNGQPVVGGFGVLYFTNCQDFTVENLVIDGNRANRVPNASGAYNVAIQNSCARGLFDNVRSINSVIDGFTLTTSVGGTLSTYPTDITLRDCVADNSYRCGLSPIATLRLTVDGGSYINSNGTSPEDGIDVEPDIVHIFGNTDLIIRNTRLYGNIHNGLTVTGANTTPNTNVTLIGLECSANNNAHVLVAQAQNLIMEGGRFGNLVGNASFGAVQIGAAGVTVRDAQLRGLDFNDSTSTAAPACLVIHSSTVGLVTLDDIGFSAIDTRAILCDVHAFINGVDVQDCSSTNPAIQVSGARSVLRNIKTDNTVAAGAYLTGADIELDGVTVIDFGASASAGVQFEAGATGSIARNISFHQRTSIPVGAFGIRYNTVVPRIIQNVSGKSAGTDFTGATIISFGSGTAGAVIEGVVPDPFRVATTWNPPNIVNGASANVTVAVTGVGFLDQTMAAMDVDLQGLGLSSYVSSAGNIRVILLNNTGGAIDIANSNLVVWAEKRGA